MSYLMIHNLFLNTHTFKLNNNKKNSNNIIILIVFMPKLKDYIVCSAYNKYYSFMMYL